MSCLRKFQRNRFSFKCAKIYPRKLKERRIYITNPVGGGASYGSSNCWIPMSKHQHVFHIKILVSWLLPPVLFQHAINLVITILLIRFNQHRSLASFTILNDPNGIWILETFVEWNFSVSIPAHVRLVKEGFHGYANVPESNINGQMCAQAVNPIISILRFSPK